MGVINGLRHASQKYGLENGMLNDAQVQIEESFAVDLGG